MLSISSAPVNPVVDDDETQDLGLGDSEDSENYPLTIEGTCTDSFLKVEEVFCSNSSSI